MKEVISAVKGLFTVLSAIVVFILFFPFTLVMEYVDQIKLNRKFDDIFSDGPVSFPKIKMQWYHGYPNYTFTFKNKTTYELAKSHGLLDLVKARVQTLHGDLPRFDSSIATKFDVKP